MKFSYFPFLCLIGSALAAPYQLAARDTTTIQRSLDTIRSSLQNLAGEVRSLDSHKQGQSFNQHVALIKHHGEELAGTINGATGAVLNAPVVNFAEALYLYPYVQQLTDATAAATQAWIYQKNTIIRSGGQQVVVNILRNLKITSEAYTKALISKMPTGANYVGEYFGNKVSRSVADALAAFGAR